MDVWVASGYSVCVTFGLGKSNNPTTMLPEYADTSRKANSGKEFTTLLKYGACPAGRGRGIQELWSTGKKVTKSAGLLRKNIFDRAMPMC